MFIPHVTGSTHLHLSHLRFDKPFEKVELVKVTAVEYAFLSAHGIGIIELKVSIDDLGLANHNEPMELLLLCPSLKKLTLVGMRNVSSNF